MTEKELILIPCSGRKTPDGSLSLEGRQLIEALSTPKSQKLKRLRKKVAGSFNIDLSSGSSERCLMPAYKRYSGNLYKKISSHAWEELKNREDLEVVIISALYGAIYWDEPIIDYDVDMTKNIKEGRRLNTWWRKNGLPEIVSAYIEGKDHDVVRSFLSGDYRKALLNIQEKVDPTWLLYEYPALGSGSNYYRGRDVSDAIMNRNVVCPNCSSKKTRRISKDRYGCVSCKEEYRV